MIPYPAAGHDALVERLLYIKQQVGLDVLIPTLDSEIPIFIEINPRFPAWVYFAAGVGSNLPLALVRRALGDHPSNCTPFSDGYPSGRLYIRYTDERVCDMRAFQNMVTQGESL